MYFSDKISYTKTTLWELKEGDVFICCYNTKSPIKEDFSVMIWEVDWTYIANILHTDGEIEYIDRLIYFDSTVTVYKFNRE
jgi:hypothetical protein